jgi:hypothetical protein
MAGGFPFSVALELRGHMEAEQVNEISDQAAAHYQAEAARARRLQGVTTTPRLKEYLRELIAECERLAAEAARV